jgi:hypothetical protein
MTTSFSTSCLRFLSTSHALFTASLASPLAPQAGEYLLISPHDGPPRFEVCNGSGFPQFCRHRVVQPFDDDKYERIWIETVNAEWRKIVERHPSTLALFYGPLPYEQFAAAFDFFESLVEAKLGPWCYRIDDVEAELAKSRCVDVSTGYCMLGARVAGLTLHFDEPLCSPTVDSHQIVAEIMPTVSATQAHYETCYALGV